MPLFPVPATQPVMLTTQDAPQRIDRKKHDQTKKAHQLLAYANASKLTHLLVHALAHLMILLQLQLQPAACSVRRRKLQVAQP